MKLIKGSRFMFICIFSWMHIYSSCNVSLNGVSIPSEVKSVTINYFPNQSAFVANSLSQTFTESLKDKFNTESNLFLTETDADWEFSGAIINYTSNAVAPTGNETTALNRLTISIKVEFVNHINEELNWNQTFSRYADYESSKILSQIEGALIEEITTQICDDIFLKVAGNW